MSGAKAKVSTWSDLDTKIGKSKPKGYLNTFKRPEKPEMSPKSKVKKWLTKSESNTPEVTEDRNVRTNSHSEFDGKNNYAARFRVISFKRKFQLNPLKLLNSKAAHLPAISRSPVPVKKPKNNNQTRNNNSHNSTNQGLQKENLAHKSLPNLSTTQTVDPWLADSAKRV